MNSIDRRDGIPLGISLASGNPVFLHPPTMRLARSFDKTFLVGRFIRNIAADVNRRREAERLYDCAVQAFRSIGKQDQEFTPYRLFQSVLLETVRTSRSNSKVVGSESLMPDIRLDDEMWSSLRHGADSVDENPPLWWPTPEEREQALANATPVSMDLWPSDWPPPDGVEELWKRVRDYFGQPDRPEIEEEEEEL